MATSSDIISTLSAHGMILAREINATDGTSFSNTALAARTIDSESESEGCTNPDCKAKIRSTHTTANCYWPGGGKEGQFPPDFGMRSRASLATFNPEQTRHFALSARVWNIPRLERSGILINTPTHWHHPSHAEFKPTKTNTTRQPTNKSFALTTANKTLLNNTSLVNTNSERLAILARLEVPKTTNNHAHASIPQSFRKGKMPTARHDSLFAKCKPTPYPSLTPHIDSLLDLDNSKSINDGNHHIINHELDSVDSVTAPLAHPSATSHCTSASVGEKLLTPLTVVTKHKPTTLPTGTDITSTHELETGPTTGTTTINNHHHINRHHSGCHWHHVNRRQPSTSVIPIISHLDPCHDHTGNQPATSVIPVLGYHDPCHHRDNQVTDSGTTLPLMSSTSHNGIISSSSDRQLMESPTGRRLGSPQTSPETEVHRLLLCDSEMTERMATIYGGGTWITNWKFERLQANNDNITRILISIPHNPTHSLLTHSQVNRDTYWSGNTLSIAAGSYDANYSRRNNFIFMGELGINLRDESESTTDATVTAIFYLSHLFKFKLSLTGTGLGIAIMVQVTITDNPFHPSPPNPEPTTGINLTKNLSINSTSPAGTSTNLPVNDKRSESDSSPMTINLISLQSHQSLASASSITYTSLHLLDAPYYYWLLVLPRHLFEASCTTTTISPSLSGFLTTLKSTSSIATMTTSLLFNTKAYYSSPSNHYAATTTMLPSTFKFNRNKALLPFMGEYWNMPRTGFQFTYHHYR